MRPVIDRVYPLDQIAEAHRYVESWHKLGNVVVAMPRDWPRRPASGARAGTGFARAASK